ncbi:dCTP deaminase [Candidatus Pyrohabitans sp.]
MYLGHGEILRRIREQRLLENVEEANVQGAGVDLRIDRLYDITSPAALLKEERTLPELREIEGERYLLAPGKYLLCTTMERVNMPHDLVAFMFQRSTLFRCGVTLRTAVIDPGYRGVLTVGIKNEGSFEFTLERGARIAQIVFARVAGEAMAYEGRYQGGRVR